jgi:uncharacterized protein DUF6244
MPDWGTDAINNELAGATKGLGIAQSTLAEAAEYAERAAAKMAAGGLRGVAAGIGQIKGKIEQDHSEVGEINTSVADLSATVGKITTHTTPQEVTTTLTPVVESVSRLDTDTMKTKQSLGDTETLIRRNLEGGQPEHLLYRVGKARGVMDGVKSRLDKAKTATEESLRRAAEGGTTEGK